MLALPKTRAEIAAIQAKRKRRAVEQAKRAPFYQGKLDHIDLDRLDDEAWRKIPILDKDMLRALSDSAFYDQFCLKPDDGIAEFWRSGGATGTPLFYPRSFEDIRYAMTGFSRIYQCAGCTSGGRAHISFPLGIHPVGQMLARCATDVGIAVNWAGSGTTTPSVMQIELIDRLKPTIWMGMSSYGLHLANLAEQRGLDLAASSVSTILCSAEPLSDAKRAKLARQWGAQVRDTFGMTEAGMMGAEDAGGGGFRIWTDMFFVEVLDPDSHQPVGEGETGCLVVTPLWTNNVTPFLRWSSGDLVTLRETAAGEGPFSVFPLVKHAHRTTGFFKVRGINLNHAELEDFMFRNLSVADFKAELVSARDLDVLRLSIEVRRDTAPSPVSDGLQMSVRDTFGLTPEIVVLDAGTLAKEFEASVKTPRFVDRRQ
ncbi:MAG TPA: AMP-binding protein [Xanthobacteraceae bacterium]|nr:AMP-binding protein [Xanthobacteraceae bacterium]